VGLEPTIPFRQPILSRSVIPIHNAAKLMAKSRKYTDEQFVKAVASSTSVRQTLKMLGLREAGGNYHSIQSRCKAMGLNTDHWTGQGWSKGRTVPSYTRRNLGEILIENSPHKQSHSLKLRLIKEGILINECAICTTRDWLDKPLSLHLDHINGIRNDNRLTNLRLLCPNCHSQTETYCGRNIGKQ
jgi:hypothetical protein